MKHRCVCFIISIYEWKSLHASKQIINTSSGYKISDYTTNLLTGSDTPGSIVKGASMLTGYKTGMLNIGDVFYDKCIKFKNTPFLAHPRKHI